eukprot:1890171-Amphidinium_carterae.1
MASVAGDGQYIKDGGRITASGQTLPGWSGGAIVCGNSRGGMRMRLVGVHQGSMSYDPDWKRYGKALTQAGFKLLMKIFMDYDPFGKKSKVPRKKLPEGDKSESMLV